MILPRPESSLHMRRTPINQTLIYDWITTRIDLFYMVQKLVYNSIFFVNTFLETLNEKIGSRIILRFLKQIV